MAAYYAKIVGYYAKIVRLMSKGGEAEYYTYSQGILPKKRAGTNACPFNLGYEW